VGHNDHIDMDLHYAITDLVDEGYIEDKSPAYGVAQQVIHSGYDSLSQKQRILYDSVVVPALSERGKEIKMIHITNSAQD